MSIRRRGAVVAGLLAATAVALALLALFPPAYVSWLFARDLPSGVAGARVPPVSPAPAARIAVAGDTGTGDAAERATAERMRVEGAEHPFDALLLLGDLVYDDGDAALVRRRVTKPFAPVLDDGADLLPVLGNHDYRSGEQRQIMTALGRGNPWYADRVGPVRVLVLDSNRVSDPAQTQWLQARLAQPQPPGTWTVAAMHHPPYSAGWHGSDLRVRRAWSPLFAAAGVRLVLAGHDHDYQRSDPQAGVTYVVSGAGAKTRKAGRAEFTAVSTSTLHFLDLLVYPQRLVGRAIDQSGRLVDRFVINR